MTGFLPSNALEHLEAALEHFSEDGAERTTFLRRYRDRPASRRQRSTSSRQARSARVGRALATGAAGCLLMGAEDTSFAAAFLSSDVARLRPYRASCHRRIHYYVTTGRAPLVGHEKVWELAVSKLFDLGRSGAVADRDTLLSMNAAIGALLGHSVLFGLTFRPLWRELWRDAGRRRLLDNHYVRMQLCRMAAYVGECGPSVDFLADERCRSLEMTNVYTFVRDELSEAMLDEVAGITAGRLPEPRACLALQRPSPTLGKLLGYARMTLRTPQTFCNEATALMALTWIADAYQRAAALSAHDHPPPTLASSLTKTASVQVQEKNRFWDIVERVPPGPTRRRLEALWSQAPPAVS